jgi:hypothetical protein
VKRSQLAVVFLALTAAAVAAGVAPAAAGDADLPRDRKPPQLDISVTPHVLANPNGRLRSVQIAGEVEDNDAIEDVFLASVESSDSGDSRDIAGARIGFFDDEVLLRAERSSGESRTYRITYVAVDAAGNRASASATVSVPAE